MNILLIIPRYVLTNKKSYEYGYPLGLGYISSVMKKEGYTVDCINLNHFNGTTEQILNKKLNSKKYDIVCSGHTGVGYPIIEKIVNISKIHPSNPKIILGGAIITSEPQLMFNALKPDFAVVGEGERTILELLDALENHKDFSKINGIIYWENNSPRFTKQRETIMDLTELPIPDFEGIGFKEQLENMSSNGSPYGLYDYPRSYPIMCSRGCPFQCTFCYHSLGLKYRERSIEDIMNELKINLKIYKINTINIYDDLFSINKKRLYNFCDEIKKILNNLDWECKWTCQISVLNVDDEMLEILKDAGCYAVSFGFESYSKKVLESMKKPISPELIDKAIKLTKKHKMVLQGNFIFGDRAETKESAKKTLDYWEKNCSGDVYLGFIQPYPGSEIYKHCIKKGIIKDKLDFIKNKMSETCWYNMTDKMTDKEILQLKKDILEARKKKMRYLVPQKIKKENKPHRYTIYIECPECKKKIQYKNCHIQDRLVYTFWISCRNCKARFSLVSPIYKIGVRHYEKIDLLKRIYLKTRTTLSRRVA